MTTFWLAGLLVNAQQLTILKRKLRQQQQEIHELETTLKESSDTVVLDQSRVGRVSRMDAMQGQQMALEAMRRRQQQLVNIEHALVRMANDEYGCCVGCGADIDFRRLEFNPAATHCIHCAE